MKVTTQFFARIRIGLKQRLAKFYPLTTCSISKPLKEQKMNDSIGAGVTVNTVSRNTEIGRTERFVETIKRTHRFVPEIKEWRVCPDGVWRKTAEKQVLEQAFQFIKKDAQRIAGMEDDRDREEAIVDYRRYANRSGFTNVTALASVRLLAQLDEFDTDDDALSFEGIRRIDFVLIRGLITRSIGLKGRGKP